MPVSLEERLGAAATGGLLRMFDTAQTEWTADVMNLSLERFERRLVQEISGLRVEMAQGQATLREELAREGAALREALAQQGATLRGEVAELRTELKRDMQEGFASLRHEMAKDRFELLKWSFYFWVGQFFAVAAVVVTILRALGPTR